MGWLRRHRVLLPGVSVLARQVSEVRKVAEKRLHATVAGAARRADPALPGELVATLKTPEGARFSELERLRRPPTRTTGTAFARALERVDEVGAYRLGRLRLSQIPPNRMAALARYALGSKAPLLERAAEPKRTAMLTAVMRHLEAKAIDEALNLFQVLMATRLLNTARRKTEKERLSTLPQLEKASRVLARAAKVLFGELSSTHTTYASRSTDPCGRSGLAYTALRRFWRATMPAVETGHYGAVEDLARNRVNLNQVITHWPDMLKVVGSLVTNQVRAYDLLRMFGREGRPPPLGAAFAEYGRIAKTEHLLRVVDPVDDTYRRQMNRQLTVQESRHKLARDVCHGRRGTIHQPYRDGMEGRLGALGLVLNAIVLWTTRYIDAAVAQLRAEGHEIRDEDVARLSPLKHKNLNVLGRYSFTASVPAAGALRPLRDPDAPELDEDESVGSE
ncbi:hypothetical protein FHS32_004185 [Streptomyces albaduncus]|uniref:Tn3 transposase DDE domain-containing protein n=1 Tax=Streptomyces griseoloalbus TaxID=67303 RepID=A0A7W8BR56_9ACTN|nr:hypothetical protein [Streptomyces albaduncus]GGW71573.1 hypothetical protein GCM10010340_57270 [Streptomyces albaduncus]